MPKFLNRRNTLVVLIAVVLVGGLALPAAPGESESKAAESAECHRGMAVALDTTYRVTLRLTEGDTVHQFSAVTASRRFALAPPERRLNLSGRLTEQPDGRELLEFTLDYKQRLASETQDGDVAFTRTGNWRGSAFLDNAREIELVSNPGSSVRLSIERL